MISLHITQGWVEEICDAMNKYHGGDFYSFDSFNSYFRIWHKDSENARRLCKERMGIFV